MNRETTDASTRRFPRSRFALAALLLVTVALGLASRRFGADLPDFVAAYAGDALWAVMVFWLAALVRPGSRALGLAAVALAISFAVEASQLVHTPALDAVRATRLGALALGRGFLWSDLVCYTVGVLAAAGLDAVLFRRTASTDGSGGTEG